MVLDALFYHLRFFAVSILTQVSIVIASSTIELLPRTGERGWTGRANVSMDL